jgi:hypothetical protein
MKRFAPRTLVLALVLALCAPVFAAQNAARTAPATDEQNLLDAMHVVTDAKLFDYVKELCAPKYAGRLTGTPEFTAAAEWVASLLKTWGVQPAGDKGTYLQAFPNPYSLVFRGGLLSMNIPAGKDVIKKIYKYEDEFIPGGTTAGGEVTAEVVFVGYGVTAPELGYDDYRGVDVKGKIVLMDPEVPMAASDTSDVFKKWRPYSFHQVKLENAVAHGAKAMIYNYGPIGNPNNSYREGFVYHHVGAAVVADVFAGTGRIYADTMDNIRKDLKPQSFATGKIMTVKNVAERHPEGIGYNVAGFIPGSDPKLKDEVVIFGGHLDHLGCLWEMMPGANDNATAVAVGLGVAEAMAKCAVKPKRSVLFLFFGSEEQGVAGSDFYCEHPFFPLDKTLVFINMEGPGIGDRIGASGAATYPAFWAFIEKANQKYVHRPLSGGPASYPGRPRQDSARFFWKGVPSLTFGASGKPLPYSTYHLPKDRPELVTPEIMTDTARLFFMAVMDICAQSGPLSFRPAK